MGLPDLEPAGVALSNIITGVKTIKSGYKTSEFWVMIFGNLLIIDFTVQGFLPHTFAVASIAFLAGCYIISRGMVKSKS